MLGLAPLVHSYLKAGPAKSFRGPSRAVYVRAYQRETQEMVLDGHARGFAFFEGVPLRGIYDNMKTAVTTVFVGKERVFNRRSLVMADHYMVEPTACSPAAGWEKGHVWTAPVVQEVLCSDEHRSGASLCSACSRGTAWLLALMKSADRVPNQVNAIEALCSPGLVRSPV